MTSTPDEINEIYVYYSGDPSVGINGATAVIKGDGDFLFALDHYEPEEKEQYLQNIKEAAQQLFIAIWGEPTEVEFDFEYKQRQESCSAIYKAIDEELDGPIPKAIKQTRSKLPEVVTRVFNAATGERVNTPINIPWDKLDALVTSGSYKEVWGNVPQRFDAELAKDQARVRAKARAGERAKETGAYAVRRIKGVETENAEFKEIIAAELERAYLTGFSDGDDAVRRDVAGNTRADRNGLVWTRGLDNESTFLNNPDGKPFISHEQLAVIDEQIKREKNELEMHRADHQACKEAGFESVGELLSAYKTLSATTKSKN